MIFKGGTEIIPLHKLNLNNEFGFDWFPHESYKHLPRQVDAIQPSNMIASFQGIYYGYNTTLASLPQWNEKGNNLYYPTGPGTTISNVQRVEWETVSYGSPTDWLSWYTPAYSFRNSEYYFRLASTVWEWVDRSNATINPSVTSYEQGGYSPAGSPAMYNGSAYTTHVSMRMLRINNASSGIVNFKVVPWAMILLENWTTDNDFGFGFLDMYKIHTDSSGWRMARHDDGTNWAVPYSGGQSGSYRVSSGYIAEKKTIATWTKNSKSYKVLVLKKTSGVDYSLTEPWESSSSLTDLALSRPFIARRYNAANGSSCYILALGCEYYIA